MCLTTLFVISLYKAYQSRQAALKLKQTSNKDTSSSPDLESLGLLEKDIQAIPPESRNAVLLKFQYFLTHLPSLSFYLFSITGLLLLMASLRGADSAPWSVFSSDSEYASPSEPNISVDFGVSEITEICQQRAALDPSVDAAKCQRYEEQLLQQVNAECAQAGSLSRFYVLLDILCVILFVLVRILSLRFPFAKAIAQSIFLPIILLSVSLPFAAILTWQFACHDALEEAQEDSPGGVGGVVEVEVEHGSGFFLLCVGFVCALLSCVGARSVYKRLGMGGMVKPKSLIR